MSTYRTVKYVNGDARVVEVQRSGKLNEYMVTLGKKTIGIYARVDIAKTYCDHVATAPKVAAAEPSVGAEHRTLSLFTRKTDLESPAARDGSAGDVIPKRRAPRGKTPPKWEQGGGAVLSWVRRQKTGLRKGEVIDQIRCVAQGRYEADHEGKRYGVYETLAAAQTALEAVA